MKPAITLLFILLCIAGTAQTPFTTYSRPSKAKIAARLNIASTYQAKLAALDTISMADYFDHMNANIVTSSTDYAEPRIHYLPFSVISKYPAITWILQRDRSTMPPVSLERRLPFAFHLLLT